MPKLTFLGHACFLLEEEGESTLIFDPFLSANPQAALKAEQVKADYILVSHAHHDHLGDAYTVAKNNGATIISTAEIAGAAQGEGCQAHALHIGGKYSFPFGWVKLTPAFHGSGIPGGHACGFVVHYAGKNLYFAGDTGLFGDMKLIGELTPLDLALLPIGDNFTMGIDDAVMAASFLKAPRVVPYHYNTWPVIKANPEEFKKKVEEKTGAQCTILAPGESIRY
ncbi:MAG TPA: metal-dependent hydrolase [Bacillota bacterium]|jgi:L-ascorbate metabolism protein UlaG (beta-lactamase superfamily)|nr:metal-dependent hydrolase [Bacillota bacterium]HOB86703.1 metal-dependent hydrolase [Bacillota bacterium]HOP69124.1 metal-dependent hydrolase [Bacillota bacterium]HPT33639.1 metal-dependent hydrolase [Bacillota bacterium]HQD06547.1 metal-dependent hydrolase [Bacillota bacterium]